MLRQKQTVLICSGGAYATLVLSPFHPPNPACCSVEVRASNEAYIRGGGHQFCAGDEAVICTQFRAGARTVLRTGRILTLHPFEGAAERPEALRSDPFGMNNLR